MPYAIQRLVSLQAEVYRAVRRRFDADGLHPLGLITNYIGLAELMYACIQPHSNYPADDRIDGYTVVSIDNRGLLFEILHETFDEEHIVWRHIRP